MLLSFTVMSPNAPSAHDGSGWESVATNPMVPHPLLRVKGCLNAMLLVQRAKLAPYPNGCEIFSVTALYPFGSTNVISVRPMSILGPSSLPNKHHLRSTAPVTLCLNQYGASGAVGYESRTSKHVVAGLVSEFTERGVAYSGHPMSNPMRSAGPCPSQYTVFGTEV